MLAKPLSPSQGPEKGTAGTIQQCIFKFCLTYFIAQYTFESLGANNCWKNLTPTQYIRHYSTNLHP